MGTGSQASQSHRAFPGHSLVKVEVEISLSDEGDPGDLVTNRWDREHALVVRLVSGWFSESWFLLNMENTA